MRWSVSALALGGVATSACVALSPAVADTGAVGPAAAGNGMNPVLLLGPGERDPAGLSPYRLPASRTPAGPLHALPWLAREPGPGASGWAFSGFGEAGVLGGDAGERNALFRKYRDLANGVTLNRFDAQAYHAEQARYVEIVGGGIGRHDQFLGLQLGRVNDVRISLSVNDTPHLGSTSARPMWQGIGSGALTLTPAPGVAAGGASTNNASNAAALKALLERTPAIELGLVRRSGVAQLELRLAEGWTLTSSYALERRRGSRAFGGNQGNGETVEPIDYRTHELRAGVQFADTLTQFNLTLAASLFRNAIDTLSWENPFQHPVGALRIQGGRADLVPDNEAYSAKLELARALPWLPRGRFTASVDLGVQRQNDRLIAPTLTAGIGAPFGTGFDGNFERWNTTAALGQERAHARIDTRLVDLGLSFAPLDRLTLRGTLRHQDTRNATAYTAYNPLTGQYGYIIQDTNASRVFDGSNNIHYRSIPFDGAQDRLQLVGELQLRPRARLSAELERDDVHRRHRERERTWEDRLRLAYTDRGFEAVTLRLAFEQARRRGSDYVSDPYREFYTESLPGYTVTRANLLDRLYSLAELRKFDLADRRQQLLKARLNLMPTATLDLGVSLQASTNAYPADFGRSGEQTQQALNLDFGYLPTTATTLHGHFSRQRQRLQLGSAADLGGPVEAGCFSLPPSCSNSFGAPRSIYPADLGWRAESRDRSSSAGLGLRHDFGRGTIDMQLSQVSTRSPLAYAHASVDALQSPAFAAQAGDGFADISTRQRTLDLGLRLPLTRTLAVRLQARHESTRISDWHYTGLDQGLVVGNRVYLDAGPRPYRASFFGVFVQLAL